MKRYQRVALVAGIVLFGGVVLASNRSTVESALCVTQEQVVEHLDRSRNGISLTCNETVRQHNLARMGQPQG